MRFALPRNRTAGQGFRPKPAAVPYARIYPRPGQGPHPSLFDIEVENGVPVEIEPVLQGQSPHILPIGLG